MFQYTREMCYEIARKCETRADYKRMNASAYKVSRVHKWLDDYTWFVNGFARPRRWTLEKCTEEARKYTRKVDFQRKSSGAYHAAEHNGWLSTFTWMRDGGINLETGRIYCVYRYVFSLGGKNYAYVGLTMRPVVRDRRHREGDSSVYDFAKLHGIAIPKMEIVYSKLTQVEARDREDCYKRELQNGGYVILNRAKTGAGIGSVGGMHRKWGRKACYEEAKRFKSRGEFQHKSPSAYQAALSKKWIDDYDWFETVHHAKWTKEAFLEIARGCASIRELSNCNMGAYIAGRINNWIELCDWFVPGQGWKTRVPRPRSDSREINQYTLDGQFIAKHRSLTDAIRTTGVSNLRKCLIGERKQAGGFVWRYAT